ncbi:MAG: ornithine cyclodeaminase family protein [Pseudomonadota bacterium]
MKNPPIILNADEVEALLPQIDILQEMRSLFVELGNKQAVQPSQKLTLFPQDKGDFITYLGAATGTGTFGAKLSPYLVKEGAPIITAWTVLMSMETGLPLLLCDSGRLTTERTAATTALAVDFLADNSARKLTIIGAGAIAQAHWRHVEALRDWSDIRVFSPSLASDGEKWADWQKLCPNAIRSDSAEEAVSGADVVLLCTSSGTPVVDANAIASHALVTSISTNVAQAHEVDPAFLNNAQVYCDYRETTPTTAGEMVLATNEHGWNAEALSGDLAELSIGACALPTRDRPTFFRSVGLGLEDIAVANAIYRAASA